MNCQEFEILLCDYIDGTLDAERKAEVEAHLGSCATCAELAQDVHGAVAFMERVADVDPPAELVTRILFDTRSGAQAGQRRGVGGWIRHWIEPVLQPRFAMGMAMTILSVSMLGRFAGIAPKDIRLSNLAPAHVLEVVDDKTHAVWERTVKYYESLRLVFEIQTRLRELTADPDQGAPNPAGLRENQTKQQPGLAPGGDPGSKAQAAPDGAQEGVTKE